MTYPTYASTGLPYASMVDSWGQPDLYLDPTETDMEGGNKRLRAKPGNNVQRITFDILFTKAQADTFKTFVRSTLNFGTSRFTMTVWMGSAFVLKTVQFAKKPQQKAMEPKVSMSFDLWVLD